MYLIVIWRNWYFRIFIRWIVVIWMDDILFFFILSRDIIEWWWWSIYYSTGSTFTLRIRGELSIVYLIVCIVYLFVDLFWVVCCFIGCLDREVNFFNIIFFSGLVLFYNVCSYGYFEVIEFLIKVFFF